MYIRRLMMTCLNMQVAVRVLSQQYFDHSIGTVTGGICGSLAVVISVSMEPTAYLFGMLSRI
jgi:nicotinamide riboside transporter PnuC